MKSRFIALFCGSCLLLAVAAQAEELPARKAGLWEIKITASAGGAASPMQQSTRQCVDAASEKKMGVVANQMTCSKRDTRKTAGGYVIDAVCEVGGMAVTSHTEITGNFDSGYTMKQTGHIQSGAAGKAGMDTTTTIEAKWQGACPAGWQPGDTELPGGRKMNLMGAGK